MSLRLASISSACSAAFDANEIPVSVDLLESTKFLLDFLSEISARPELYEGPLVECAIQRYERYWLPLVAKHPGRLLPAPLDIEWVWHCHMLCPEAYNTDCKNIVGKVIDHHLIDRAKRKDLIKDSERLWRKEYTDVPFSACDAVTPWFDCEFVSALTYNLASAIYRQRTFNYQVSLPHYRDEKFLNSAILRYKKFLYLKLNNPGMFLVPCCDTDLMWHTHMLHPHFYKDDTQSYLSCLLPHDDAVSNRSPGSKLSLYEAKTRNLWRKVFNEKFSYYGAMYRGEPPNSKLNAMSREDIFKVCSKQADVLLERIRITGLPTGKSFKLKLCYNTGYQNFSRSLYVTENIATVKGNSRTFEDNRINVHFQFDTRYNDKVIVNLQQKSGRLCLGSSDVVGEGKVDLLKKIQPLTGKGITANDEVECGDSLSIGLVWSCSAPSLGPCVLRLEPGDYQSCIMPEDKESLWGPIPLPRLPAGVVSVCSVASHQLLNHTKKVVFTVRMIHSEPLLMSAVHVFYGEKMSAVAHLVVGDQLPLPEMVSDTKKCITLNPKEGQRAVLIKNYKGDWGVAVGWWEGIQRKVPGRKGSCSEGHLEVRFFHLPNNRWHYVSFDRLYSLATSKFEIGDCVVEFDSGFIEINSERGEIAENLALIFSVALIHVLCQPRPVNWAPKVDTVTPEIEPVPKLGGSEDIALLLAAGVLIATPCNHAIRNLFKKKRRYGDNGGFKHGSQKSQYEQNGGPAAILHESEVNTGWKNEWHTGSGHINVGTAETVHGVGGLLSVIKEQTDTECEDSADDKTADSGKDIDEDVTRITDRTALLMKVDDSDKGDDLMNSLNSSDLLKGIRKDSDQHEGASEEEEEESDRQSEGVFEVEGYNLDADSRTVLFGNGEDDSDEADLEIGEIDPENRPDDCNEEDDLCHNQSFDSDKIHEDFCADQNEVDEVGFENDVDNYYDEFYNIEGDDNVAIHETEVNTTGGAGKSVWDSYGDDVGNLMNDYNAGFGGFASNGYNENENSCVAGSGGFGADTSFTIENCNEGHDASSGGFSHYSSDLFETNVAFGVGADIAMCSSNVGECIEAGVGDVDSGF
ncbi:hypothetical protein BsWGS_12025 [Bradybaena similaris]